MADSDENLERRLAAVERAIDGETRDRTVEAHDPEALDARLTTLESRVDELDAAVQAVRGFLGGVSAVNEAVERRADAAVAAVERLESRLDGEERGLDRQEAIGDDSPSRPDGNDYEIETVDGDSGDTGLRERLRGLR